MPKRIATRCPVCSGELSIGRLCCSECDTRIDTSLEFDPLMRLPDDLRQFVMIFLRCRGNIREVEKELGISYPTVCKRLDLVNEHLAGKAATAETGNGKPLSRHDILAQLERGEITAKEAAELLKGR
jgi:hypothetical protein